MPAVIFRCGTHKTVSSGRAFVVAAAAVVVVFGFGVAVAGFAASSSPNTHRVHMFGRDSPLCSQGDSISIVAARGSAQTTASVNDCAWNPRIKSAESTAAAAVE